MKTLVCSLFLLASVSLFGAAKAPNILFIAIDDLNDWIGPLGGHPQAQTPYLDKFCDEGAVVFRNSFCAGPVCGPSRSALLSGLMPHNTGVYGNSQNMLHSKQVQEVATLPEYFTKNGYLTLSRGKISHKHGTPGGMDQGQWAYDIWEHAPDQAGKAKEGQYQREEGIINSRKIENPEFTERGGSPFAWGPTLKGKEHTKDYLTAQWAAEQLQQSRDKPFFLAVGFSKPHLTWHVPQEYFDRYDLDTLETPSINPNDLDDIRVKGKETPAYSASNDYNWVMRYGLLKEATRAYLASVSYVDECIGVVTEALKNSPHADNTIVVIWGDHGWHLGEKLRYRKAALWIESVRNPLIIRAPFNKTKQYSSRPVNLIDLYPTLVDLCGLPQKERLDGRSIAPLLRDPQARWDHPSVTTGSQTDFSIVTERWHYIHREKSQVHELYDLKADPMEWTNLYLAPNKEQTQAIARLRKNVPKNPLPGIPNSTASKDFNNKNNDTIKATRNLAKLK